MQSASKDTYISGRMIEAYVQQRAERQQQKAGKSVPVKNFDEDKVVAEEAKQPEQSAKVEQEKKKGFFDSILSAFGKKDSPKQNQSVPSKKASMEIERNLSCEELDSDDLDGDMNLSDEENHQRNALKQKNKMRRQKKGKKEANKYHQEADTNVFQVSLACLQDDAKICAGDPESCSTCQAVLSKDSNLVEVEGKPDTYNWQCEFCFTTNEVTLDQGEIPSESTVNYLVEAAAQLEDKKDDDVAMTNEDETSVIFCVDISGSMSWGAGKSSRIQCVQSAIVAQIEDMAKNAEKRKVGLVTFNNQVSLIGDGTQAPQNVGSGSMNDYDFLIKNGKIEAAHRMNTPIGENKQNLLSKLRIQPGGGTALGPGVATAIAMAAEGKKGSTVVICTDGLANQGLGAFHSGMSKDEVSKVDEFYEKIGQFAKDAGVTVNVVTMDVAESNIDSLSKLAELTGGNVDRVNPNSMTQNFGSMLAEPSIATNVVCKVKLHKGLQFRNELPQVLNDDKTLLVKDLGNVTRSSMFTFEYTLRKISELIEMEDIDLTQLKSIPFQCQISYTALDGSRYIRVINQNQQVSNNRQELEKKADYRIISTNAIQQSSKIARTGDLKQAQVIAKTWNRKMRSNLESEEQIMNYQEHQANFAGVYSCINQEKAAYQSDSEDSADELQDQVQMMQMKSFGKKKKQVAMPTRSMMASAPKQKSSIAGKQSDILSTALFKASKISTPAPQMAMKKKA